MLSPMLLTFTAQAFAPPERDLLFASAPKMPMCPATEPAFTSFGVDLVAEKNKVFAQLTVAEQVSIEAFMKTNYGITTEAWEKGATSTPNFIAKIAYVYPPKAEVLGYMAGGMMPARKAKFWWFKGHESPRVASECHITLPITSSTVLDEVRIVPWAERPFVYWDHMPDYTTQLEILAPIWADILASVVISPEMKALAPDAYGPDSEYPYIEYTDNGLSVPGSSPTHREHLGSTHIISGPEDGWTMGMFKSGPLTFTTYYDYETDTSVVKDLVFCPGMGNPTYSSPQELLDAFNAGTLKMCGVDTEFYGSTAEYMDPAPPYFLPDDMAMKAEPRIYCTPLRPETPVADQCASSATHVFGPRCIGTDPDGPRFAVKDRTVSWMGWDFHVDIHGMYGLMIANLRYQGERLAYVMHATEFSAVYSGFSNKKDLYYSDGGYEMGNCATTLKTGLQCPDEAVYLPSLGYDSGYVWGGALEGSETDKAVCIFEAPKNRALYQHAQMRYEGMPDSALYVRTVLTVGNYDYTQTFEVNLDGSFHWNKELSGYAVGSYVLPDAPSTVKSDMFGAMLSKSSTGTLHTHSAGYKFDLDVAGTSNSFAVKTLKYGPMAEAIAASSIPMDLTGIAHASPHTYYYETSKIANEGVWDMDGDNTWTPPPSCLMSSPGTKFLVKSDQVNKYGQARGYLIDVPIGQHQLLPEHDPFLHLQNFTKCSIMATKQNDADIEPMSMEVFGNLYPKGAATGTDLSHFADGESLDHEDLVIYASSTKPHWVKTEDLPVPSTMGKPISFEPVNYFVDGLNPMKHMPATIKMADTCVVSGA